MSPLAGGVADRPAGVRSGGDVAENSPEKISARLVRMKRKAAAQKVGTGVGSGRLGEDRNQIGVVLGIRITGDRMGEAVLPAEFETGTESAGFAEVPGEP